MMSWSPTVASHPHSNRSSLIHFCSFQANQRVFSSADAFVVVIVIDFQVDVDVHLGDGLGVEVEVDSVTT